jgi:hypothetical protein
MPAISLIIVSIWCAARQRALLGGILLGVACAIKPQVAGPFFLYYVLMRRWKLSIAAMFTGGLVLAIALVAMQVSQINWLEGWTRSIKDTGRVNDVNDYGWGNPFRDEILDLKMVLVSFIQNPALLKAAIGGISLALLAWFVAVFPRGERRSIHRETLALAALSGIILMPIYHRVYDASLLAIALAWALAELNGNWKRYAWLMLAAMTPFLIPFAMVKSVSLRVESVRHIGETWWWETFFAPHYAWGLLFTTLAILLVSTRLRGSRAQLAAEAA